MAQPEANNSGLNVLSVVWYKVLPPFYGGQKAVALFNEALGKQVALVCLCSSNNEGTKANYKLLPELPLSKLQFLNPVCWYKIYCTVRKEAITHLILEFPYYGIPALICKRWLKTIFILNAHNIEYLRFGEQNKWWWKLLFYFERWTMRQADFIFFKTAAERQTAVNQFRLSEAKSSVLPYGVNRHTDINKKAARSILEQRHHITTTETVLLFAGTLDYAPNAAAVKAIYEKLVPALNLANTACKIIICGRNKNSHYSYLTGFSNDRVLLLNEVDDIETYFSGADVFINPVCTGGGVQTKTLEALSYDLNVVCFENKTSGIEGAEEKIFAVPVNSWTGFAKAIVNATQTTTQTPDRFFTEHNWDRIAGKAAEKLTAL